MVVFTKKRGKHASFFINPIPPYSNKNDGSDSVERVHKSPKSTKSIKKPESFAEHDLENIKIVTLSMHLINTLMLYRKDNLGGHSSTVCTDVRFFKKKSFFKERAGL